MEYFAVLVRSASRTEEGQAEKADLPTGGQVRGFAGYDRNRAKFTFGWGLGFAGRELDSSLTPANHTTTAPATSLDARDFDNNRHQIKKPPEMPHNRPISFSGALITPFTGANGSQVLQVPKPVPPVMLFIDNAKTAQDKATRDKEPTNMSQNVGTCWDSTTSAW